jgi:hypothetical protein
VRRPSAGRSSRGRPCRSARRFSSSTAWNCELRIANPIVRERRTCGFEFKGHLGSPAIAPKLIRRRRTTRRAVVLGDDSATGERILAGESDHVS